MREGSKQACIYVVYTEVILSFSVMWEFQEQEFQQEVYNNVIADIQNWWMPFSEACKRWAWWSLCTLNAYELMIIRYDLILLLVVVVLITGLAENKIQLNNEWRGLVTILVHPSWYWQMSNFNFIWQPT